METPLPNPSFLYPLFEHMQEEHKLTLLNCELEEICLIVEGLKKPDAEAFAAAVGVPAFHAVPVPETPLSEVLAALEGLLRATVDTRLADGYGLSDAEVEARAAALGVFEKYGKGGE